MRATSGESAANDRDAAASWRQTQRRIDVPTAGQGLVEITRQVAEVVAASGVRTGVCTVFVRHTSASLVVQENADPSARRDLDAFFKRLVPERLDLYTHTAEGPDDMPAHIRAALTATSLSISVAGGALALGTWQGIYVWEHRARGATRGVVAHVIGTADN